MAPDISNSSYFLPTALFLLIVFQSTIATDQVYSRIDNDCMEISKTSQCRCSKSDFQFNITCSTGGPSFTVALKVVIYPTLKVVEIQCHRADIKDLDLLPNITIDSIHNVFIYNCPFQQEQPIQTILQRLGITKPIGLHLKNTHFSGSLQVQHFEGLQDLNKLTMSSAQLTTLPDGLFSNLTNLTSLDVSFNNLELNQDIFSALKNLSYLNLIGNKLLDLPPGIFRHQKKLKRLYLANNNLTDLQKEAFEGLNSVTELDLHSNNIKTLRQNIFAGLTDLRFINLNENHIRSLPDGLFAKNKKLSSFNLVNNRVPLKQIPLLLLSDLPFLREVHLNCGLTTIPAEVFSGSKDIEKINISGNNLTELPLKLFEDQRKLVELDLSRNQFVTLSDYMLRNTTELRKLRLSHNRLQNISSFVYSFLLTGVQLNSIDSRECFVDLTYNSIRTIDVNEIAKLNITGMSITIDVSYNPIDCDCRLLSFVQFLSGHIGHQLKDVLKFSTEELLCYNSKKNVRPEELFCPLDDEDTSEKQCPTGCTCDVRSFDATLIIKCWYKEFSKIPLLPVLTPNETLWKSIELHMENNTLTELPLATTPGYDNVRRLYVSHNRLATTSIGNLPRKADLFDVSHNQLKGLSNSLLNAFKANQITTALSNNPWSCNCTDENIGFLNFVVQNETLIVDREKVQCVIGDVFHEIPGICQKIRDSVYKPLGTWEPGNLIIAISVIGLCLGVLAALYFKYQLEIKVWLYSHKMCLWFVSEEELDRNKKYDAFISYSHKDEDFIENHLIPELEDGPIPFKLCLHSRDWIVGGYIPDQIIRSVNESRRTIIVLSSNFIESVWARLEFKTAHTAALTEGRERVIVIIYGDIGGMDNLDPTLTAYLQMNTYVKWGDPWFWNRLRYAMPHQSNINDRNMNPGLNLLRVTNEHEPIPIITFPTEELNDQFQLIEVTDDQRQSLHEVFGEYSNESCIMNTTII